MATKKTENEVMATVEETPVETVAAETVNEESAEKKTVAKKTTARKTTAKKTTAKKTAEETAEKPPVKKTTRRTTKKAAVNTEVFVQFWGKEVYAKDVVEQVKKLWTEEMGKAEAELTDLKVYIKPEENGAHYVINGEITGFIGL